MIGALPSVDVGMPHPDQPALDAVKLLKLCRPFAAAETAITAHVVGPTTVQARISVTLSARVSAMVGPKPRRVQQMDR